MNRSTVRLVVGAAACLWIAFASSTASAGSQLEIGIKGGAMFGRFVGNGLRHIGQTHYDFDGDLGDFEGTSAVGSEVEPGPNVGIYLARQLDRKTALRVEALYVERCGGGPLEGSITFTTYDGFSMGTQHTKGINTTRINCIELPVLAVRSVLMSRSGHQAIELCAGPDFAYVTAAKQITEVEHVLQNSSSNGITTSIYTDSQELDITDRVGKMDAAVVAGGALVTRLGSFVMRTEARWVHSLTNASKWGSYPNFRIDGLSYTLGLGLTLGRRD